MSLPKVTVICLCYNQGRFAEEAIASVMMQTYPNVELLVVDDASTDNSADILRDCVAKFPGISFFPLKTNVGNCKAFNHALAHATGEFVIDLAADDVLLEERIAEGINAFGMRDERFGVHFTDAQWISEEGKHLYKHSDRFPNETIPEGEVYRHLISRFFICSPTMMVRTSVIRALGGYDENLLYEDFDFWIRSSRDFLYTYTPRVLVKKRIVKNSMSQRQFTFFNPQLKSTFLVCRKILELNRTEAERKALADRIRYEMRVCLKLLHLPLLLQYVQLYRENAHMKYQ